MIESPAIPRQMEAVPVAGLPQAIIIILLSMLPMVAVMALVPVVPAIVDNFKDVPNIMTMAPMVLAVPGLCVALLSPFAGYLADKLGRRKLLLIFTTLYGIGGILPFFIHSFPFLIGGRLLLGVGGAFIFTIGNTLLGDYFEPKEASKWLMIQSVLGAICATLLLAFSGFLTTFGWQYPFLVYGIAFIITVASFFFIFEPAVKAEKPKVADSPSPFPAMMPVGLIATLCITTLIAAVIYFVYVLHFSLILDFIGVKDRMMIGNYTAIASIGVPVGALLYKAVSRKAIHIHLAMMGFFFGAGMLAIGFAPTITLVVVAAFVVQIGTGMTIPVLISWSLQQLPPVFRGRGMGFWNSAFFLGQFLTPLVFSGVRSLSGGLLNAFIAFGIFCLLLAIFNLFKMKKETAVSN